MLRSTGRGGRPNLRPSVLNKLALGAVVACGFAAFAAEGASAAPPCTPPACYTLTFNNAVLDAGGSPANIVTPTPSSGDPTGAPVTANANLTGSTGPGEANFDVSPSGISFPTYHFTAAGITGTIDTTLKNDATGTINFATGATTMTADFIASVNLNGVPGACNLDTGTVNMSTANTQPLMGVNFPATSTGPVTGPGAFGGTWSSVTPSPSNGQACTLLAVAGYFGQGGLWVSRNLTPPSPKVTASKLKAVKAGKTEAVHVKVANTGGVGTGAVKLCLKAPKGLKVSKACQTIKNVAAGKSSVVNFKVKTAKPKKGKKAKTKTYKLTLTPSTTTMGLAGNKGLAVQSLKLKVKA